MRHGIAAALALLALFGCLGLGAPQGSGGTKNATPDFTADLVLDNPSDLDWNVSEFNTSEIDSIADSMMFENQNITVVYFYSRDCSACKYMANWIESEKKTYNGSVVWYEYDIATADGWEKFLALASAYGVPANESYVPMVFVGGDYYWGIDGIRNDLPAKIYSCRADGCYNPFEMLKG